ncbi:hemolysin family protein [bacterium]|nr:hemolysin family protein [bacterium]
MTLVSAGVVLALILVNAFFVASEFAAVSVPRMRVEQAAESGDPAAIRLHEHVRTRHRLDRYVSASQVGISISSLILGAFGRGGLGDGVAERVAAFTGLTPGAAGSLVSVAILAGFTLLQMVLGELVPKGIALQHPLGTARWTVFPMEWILRLFRPAIAVLNGAAARLLRLFGFSTTEAGHVHSPEEIELMLAESRAGGLLEAHEHQRLNRALQLSRLHASDLMVVRARIQTIDVKASRAEIVRLATESPFTRLPVVDGSPDAVVGLLHARDVAPYVADPSKPLDLPALLRQVSYVAADLPADSLLGRLREARRQVAIVIDRDNRTLGIVSVDDILDTLLGEMADDLKEAGGARWMREVRGG